jgi:hypothetical protein
MSAGGAYRRTYSRLLGMGEGARRRRPRAVGYGEGARRRRVVGYGEGARRRSVMGYGEGARRRGYTRRSTVIGGWPSWGAMTREQKDKKLAYNRVWRAANRSRVHQYYLNRKHKLRQL